MDWESIPALSLHSRVLSTGSESGSKALLASDWRALIRGLDAGAADGCVSELAGATASASGEARALRRARYIDIAAKIAIRIATASLEDPMR
jgi:hypothetical protein